MSSATADRWTTIATAVGLSLIGVLLVVTRTNHGLIELVIAALAGLGGFALRGYIVAKKAS